MPTSSHAKDIKIAHLNKEFIGFKSTSFQAWDASVYAKSVNDQYDWSGLYIAEKQETAEGYIPDMVSADGRGIAYLQKVQLIAATNIIIFYDYGFKTGDIDTEKVKRNLRDHGIEVKSNELLIPALGKLGYLFKCYNNEEGEMEIIIPNSLINKVSMVPYKQVELKNFEIIKETILG